MNYKKLALALLVLFVVALASSYGYFMDMRYDELVDRIKAHDSIPSYVKDELSR